MNIDGIAHIDLSLFLSLSLSLSLYFYHSLSLPPSHKISLPLSLDASGLKQPPKAKKNPSSFSSTKSVKKSDNLRVVERALLNIDAIIDREKQPNVTNFDSMSDNCSRSNNGNNGNKSTVTVIESKIVSDMKRDHTEELSGVKVLGLNGVNGVDTLSTMTSGHSIDSTISKGVNGENQPRAAHTDVAVVDGNPSSDCDEPVINFMSVESIISVLPPSPPTVTTEADQSMLGSVSGVVDEVAQASATVIKLETLKELETQRAIAEVENAKKLEEKIKYDKIIAEKMKFEKIRYMHLTEDERKKDFCTKCREVESTSVTTTIPNHILGSSNDQESSSSSGPSSIESSVLQLLNRCDIMSCSLLPNNTSLSIVYFSLSVSLSHTRTLSLSLSLSLAHYCRGFVNTGNACYRNAIIQSLLTLPPLLRFVIFFTLYFDAFYYFFSATRAAYDKNI